MASCKPSVVQRAQGEAAGWLLLKSPFPHGLADPSVRCSSSATARNIGPGLAIAIPKPHLVAADKNMLRLVTPRTLAPLAIRRCARGSLPQPLHRFSTTATMSKKTEQGHEVVEPPYTGWKGDVPSQKGGSEPGYLFRPPYVWHSDEFKVKYTARCWCGKLEFEYHGDPIDAKHCHCTQCQRLHGAPFQWAALFHKTSVRLAAKCDPLYLDFFSTQEGHSDHSVPCKISCRNCRSPMADEGRNMIMAYPSSFLFKHAHVPAAFAPTAHIFYKERVLDLDDDVPKWSGHKGSSDLLPHAPEHEGDRTFGKGKVHKLEREKKQNGDQEEEAKRRR
ncbi:hypothetical protein ACQY0O_002335 [Thecaphora frezii]